VTALRPMEPDDVDWRLLAELQSDGRLSFNELGRRIHLSAPAVAERVRRLEQAGIISDYAARVDAARAGQPLVAFLQLRCSLGKCLLKTTSVDDYPEVVEIHKLSGEYCTMLKVRATSLAHFEGLIERLGTHGDMRTHIVLSTPFDGRPVQPPVADRAVTPSEGWRSSRSGDQ
jgi:Lrp/AsnC family transcriptional regulator, leucine-responsive regulatory protein